MTRLRQNCLPLFLVAAVGAATLVGGFVMRRVDGAGAPAFGLPTVPDSRVAVAERPETLQDSRTDAPAWQPVAWNDESTGNSVRVASIEQPTMLPGQRRPVVKIAPRGTAPARTAAPAASRIVMPDNSQSADTSTADAFSASPAAPTVRPVTRPTVAQPPIAQSTIAQPAVTDSAPAVDPSPAPSAPVVRVVQRKLTDLSVLGADPAEDAGADVDEGQPAVDVGGAAMRSDTVVETSPATQGGESNETYAAERETSSNVNSTTDAGDLFAPPPLPRGVGTGQPQVTRGRATNTISAPAQRDVPNAVRDYYQSPVAEATEDSGRDAAEDLVDNDPPVAAPDTAVRMVIPNAGGASISANTNSLRSTPPPMATVTPSLQQPMSEQTVADSAAPDVAPAMRPVPTFASPTVKPATPMQQPVASAPVANRPTRMRQVPPQPVAPWAMPPTPRAAVAQREPKPLPAAVTKQMPGAAVKQAPVVAAKPLTAPPSAPPAPQPPVNAVPKNTMVVAPPAVDASRRTMMPPTQQPVPVSQQAQAPRQMAPQQQGFAPTPVPMPLANVPAARPPYLMVVAQRAQEHIDYGFNLAERGATFSSETEFNEALMLVAQAMDAAEHTHAHSDAMRAAMRAFREADDFVPRDAIEPNIAQIVIGHQTPVLKRTDTTQMPLLVAMQEYYTYGQYQLGVAGGHEPTAAAALYGLARLQSVLGTGNDMKKMMCGPKAIALHQAALAIDGSNYAAANELGVLLARYGQWPEAQAAFLQSVCVSPQPESWRNLAMSYESLGDMNAARNAWGRFELARQAKQSNSVGGGDRPMVNFVDTDTFVRTSGGPEAGDMSIPQPKANEQNLAAGPRQGQPPQMQSPQQQTQQTNRQQNVTQARADEYPLNWLKSKVTAAFSSNTAQQTGGQQPQRR